LAREPYVIGSPIKEAHAEEIAETERALRVIEVDAHLRAFEEKVARLKANWPEIVRAHIERLRK